MKKHKAKALALAVLFFLTGCSISSYQQEKKINSWGVELYTPPVSNLHWGQSIEDVVKEMQLKTDDYTLIPEPGVQSSFIQGRETIRIYGAEAMYRLSFYNPYDDGLTSIGFSFEEADVDVVYEALVAEYGEPLSTNRGFGDSELIIMHWGAGKKEDLNDIGREAFAAAATVLGSEWRGETLTNITYYSRINSELGVSSNVVGVLMFDGGGAAFMEFGSL